MGELAKTKYLKSHLAPDNAVELLATGHYDSTWPRWFEKKIEQGMEEKSITGDKSHRGGCMQALGYRDSLSLNARWTYWTQ